MNPNCSFWSRSYYCKAMYIKALLSINPLHISMKSKIQSYQIVSLTICLSLALQCVVHQYKFTRKVFGLDLQISKSCLSRTYCMYIYPPNISNQVVKHPVRLDCYFDYGLGCSSVVPWYKFTRKACGDKTTFVC